MKGEIAQLIKTASSEESETESEDKTSESPSSESETVFGTETPGEREEVEEATEEIEEAEEGLGQLAPIKPNGGGPMRQRSSITLRRASTASFRGPRGKTSDEEDNKVSCC